MNQPVPGGPWVTGASGFVGRRLFRRLLDAGEHRAVALSGVQPAEFSELGVRRWLKFRIGDLTPELFQEFQSLSGETQAVYHLAGMANPRHCEQQPKDARIANVEHSARLFAFAAEHGFPVLFTSTAGVYEPSAEPHGEASALGPKGVYGRTKLEAEEAAHEAVAKGARIVIARAFNHSGPGQFTDYALPAFASKLAAARGSDDPIEVGNLRAVRDFLHVDDVLDAYQLLIAEGQSGGVYNVCSGFGVSMGELYERMGARFGFSPAELAQRTRPAAGTARPGEPDVLVGDPAKLVALGWRPKRSLDELIDDIARPLL